jgi:superfamily II DNA or RNA helicase
MIPITERFLSECGGWQALREARSLQAAGRVLAATYEPPLLEGRVREGEGELRSGLRITSKSHVENLCVCRASRRDGVICAHALAVGLEWLKPHAVAADPVAPAPAAVAERVAGPRFASEDGTPLELHVVLPPNFAVGWERNAITVGMEAALGTRRVLLSALDPEKTHRVSSADEAAVEKVRELADGGLPGVVTLERTAFLALLPALAGHPRVTFARKTPATIHSTPYRPETGLPPDAVLLAGGSGAWLLHEGGFHPLAPEQPAAYAAPTGQGAAGVGRFALTLEGSLNHLTARLDVVYEDRRFTVEAAPTRCATPRDHPAERRALERLHAANFFGPDHAGQLVLKGEPKILAFFARDLPRLEKEWEVTIGSRFAHVTRDIERIQPRFEIQTSGENWFDLKYELATPGGERFSATEIQRLLQSGQSATRLRNRKLAVFDPGMLNEFQEVLNDCNPEQQQPGLYRIARCHAEYVDGVASEQGAEVKSDPVWSKWVAPLEAGHLAETANLGALESVLRPYQVEGVAWLKQLVSKRLNGLLADEMGLGKTLQALAFAAGLPGKTIVVCPSSLVFNWQREAARFTPHLRTLAIQGSDRGDLFGEPLRNADMVITSYALLRRDIEHYQGVEFAAVILDEAQHIKNPDSQNAQSAFSLKGQRRIALTGTPIENSLSDIWSLMNFLMPGYLGSRVEFRERFQQPISSDPRGPQHQRLIRRLKPCILRRLKRDVVSELPNKIEHVAYCELTAHQRGIYYQLVDATRSQWAEWASAKNQGKARMLMLTALLRLRQACCDSRLLNLADAEDQRDTSGKLILLEELLNEALDGGHRVLVFSQFASMLRILRDTLNSLQIAHRYLDGQTKDRAREVDLFESGQFSVFLISLKAGGTGLNLTQADTVIHFDPWWNPAAEDQATDRAHRIGQKNVVNSYKLIARDTVEEKILRLQGRKRALIDATLTTPSESDGAMDGLHTDEIFDLLS